MKHALITGGAGFIGSHLAETLLARDYRVTVVDDESTGTAENLAAVRDHFNFSFVQGTVADKNLVRKLVSDVDEVYHLAAAVGVQLISTAPIHTIETNIYPTELILSELLRRKREGYAAASRPQVNPHTFPRAAILQNVGRHVRVMIGEPRGCRVFLVLAGRLWGLPEEA